MAHELSFDASGNAEMMYVGETPWHGLGVKLDRLATAQEAIEAARLGWTVEKEPIKTAAGLVLESDVIAKRSDNGLPLGVVGAGYNFLQNADAFRFMDEITQDPNGPKYETAGALYEGRTVWMLARMPELMEIVPGDAIAKYLLLRNPHDGSGSIWVMETNIRVVCHNTLTAACKSSRAIKLRHSANIFGRVSAVQDALGIKRGATIAETIQGINANFEASADLYRALARVEPTKDQIDEVLQTLFPDTKSDRAKLQRTRVLELANAGRGNDMPGVRGTAWGLYNGITELVDHVNNSGSKAADAQSMRLNTNWFGSGAKFKADALDLLTDKFLN